MYKKIIDKIQKSKVTDVKWLTLFTIFFIFFAIEAPLTTSAGIYLKKSGNEQLFGTLLSFKTLSLIIMPILIPMITGIFGNIILVQIGVIIGSIFSLLIITTQFGTVGLLFYFPFLIRIFNISLVPFISKQTSSKYRSFVFAVRDVFLYLGISVGYGLVAILCGSTLNMKPIILISFIGFILILLLSIILSKKFTVIKKKPASSKKLNFPWNQIKNKKTLFTFISIKVLVTWTGLSCAFIPIYANDLGIKVNTLFGTFSIAYAIIPFVGLISSLMTQKSRKNWYIFDLVFDIVPLTMLIIVKDNYLFLFAIILIQFKDFVKPVSVAYFFDSFTKEEADAAWSLSASITAIFALIIPFIINYLYTISPTLMFSSCIFTALISGILALLFLPESQEFCLKKSLI